LDDNAIVIDPQVPVDIRGQLAEAPGRRLVRFGAAAPEVVPAPRKRRDKVLTPQGRKAVITTATMAAFFIATITTFVIAVQTDTGGVAVLGILAAIGWINRFVATARAMDGVQRAGWRQRQPTANPDHPDWDGLHAVTAYHRKYVLPGKDMDAAGRALWKRAVSAANELTKSEVVKQGLVDSVQVTTVLPYHLWDIAERLATLSALRAQHQQILRGVDADDPDVATLLGPQRRAHELANADIEQRVSQLELFARMTSKADAAQRRERAVSQLATLNDSHAELLAHIGEGTGADGLAQQMSVDVQALIDQANEAVRQANEAGRSLVLPPAIQAS
jgi:hypothetical protein